MASSSLPASGQPPSGGPRPTPAQLQTNNTGNRNQRFSWQETPHEAQRPIFHQFSSPPNSAIDESPISPPDDYQTFSTFPQPQEVARYPTEKPPVERTGSPYDLPGPHRTHPAYSAPVAEEVHRQQLAPQPPKLTSGATDPTNARQHVKASLPAPAPNADWQPRKDDPVVKKSDIEQPSLIYNPDSFAGPNATLENHRPGQAAHPNATVEPEWKHGLFYGKTQYRISRKTQKQDATNLLGYKTCNGSCGLMGLACGFQWVLASIQRARVRKLYAIKGNLASDCAKSLCSTDVLYTIFPYLDPADFLALTGCTKTLHDFRQDPNYWRILTRTTFRIPPQPLLQADGPRWQWLYRRLRTQTQLYTWGSNGSGNLGHGVIATGTNENDWADTNTRSIGWPKKVGLDDMLDPIGIVADVQSKGRHEPSTAISQFSTGRAHILGLADDGKVWQWNNEEARLVKPLHVDVNEKVVTRVVAGWDRASIFVTGTGIVYWPHDTPLKAGNAEADAILIDTVTVPGTGFTQSRNGRENPDTLGARIGQVTNHIVLENFIIFITSLNKVFLYHTVFPLPDLDPPAPVEITAFYPPASESPLEIRDLQGSFRSFAIFTKSGQVLIGNRVMLDAFNAGTTHPAPTVIPALQNNSITSIAFGDHHYQALRSNGTVLAYGADPHACGALGLGFPEGTGPLRGLIAEHFSSNGTLGHNVGRQVWFERLMQRWLGEMKEKAGMEGEAKARGDMVLPRRGQPAQNVAAVTAVGDYFEREGQKWEDGVVEEGGMGSYFVLKVAAAGWHTAALVLVDEEQAERSRQMHVVPEKVDDEVTAGKYDWHGGTWEDIDAPWDQLSNALLWLRNVIWDLGRTFLGLQERDEAVEVKQNKETEQEEPGDQTKYTWTDQPFPRLRMTNGEMMPGEIEVTE
ncbi:MAG: hypothetical protein Q9168_005382 [Polycauliona sp. 1 TL-2023]